MGDSIAEIKTKISRVVYNRTALDKLLKRRMFSILDAIDSVVKDYLEEIGEAVKAIATTKASLEDGGGARYIYVDEKGNQIGEWTASRAGNPPASLSGTLMRNIEFKVDNVRNSVSIGVYSGDLGGLFPTIAFLGPDEKKYPGVAGRLVVDEDKGKKTPAKDYAYALEKLDYIDKQGRHHPPHPFLKPSFDEYMKTITGKLSKNIRQRIQSLTGQKIPIYFRITIKD